MVGCVVLQTNLQKSLRPKLTISDCDGMMLEKSVQPRIVISLEISQRVWPRNNIPWVAYLS